MDLATVAQTIADAYTPPENGRPAGIGNADTVRELLEHIEAGCYPEIAAELSGVSLFTLNYWIKRGDAGETPYDQFSRAVKRAAAKAELTEIGKVRKAGEDPRFWAASMTYLERRHPERWARRSEASTSVGVIFQKGAGPDDYTVKVAVSSSAPSLLLDQG